MVQYLERRRMVPDDTEFQRKLVPNLQNYLFQAYISLNPSQVKQNYSIHLLEMA